MFHGSKRLHDDALLVGDDGRLVLEPLKRRLFVVVIVRLDIGFPSVLRRSFKRGGMFAEVAADGDNVQFHLFAGVFFVLFEVFKQGLNALFEHLEQIEEDTGEEMELDVITLCCDFSEHATATEAATEHDWEADAEADEDDNEEAALEWLQDQTTVIPHKKGIIVQSF